MRWDPIPSRAKIDRRSTVDPPQEFDEQGKELGPEGQVWKTYVKEADPVDNELIDGWNKSMDVNLIFAALFSAISTAFVIESYKSLKQDPVDVSAQTMLVISQTLSTMSSNGSQPTSPSPILGAEAPPFSAPASAICVNILWFLSLSLSVAASLISMLAKEWCLEFMSGRTGPPGIQARRRQQRWDGLLNWKMNEVIMTLPSLIHLSLLLFAIGLCLFLWDVHYGVAIPVILVTAVGASAYFACTILPFFYDFCPYGTVLSRLYGPMFPHLLLAFGSALSRLYRSVLARLYRSIPHQLRITVLPRLFQRLRGVPSKPVRKKETQDEVTARALHWMVVNCETPRSVDVALQSLAGAGESLPLKMLDKCDAWTKIKLRLKSLDTHDHSKLSRTIRLRYEQALKCHVSLRTYADSFDYEQNEEIRQLAPQILGMQASINSLVYESVDGLSPWNHQTKILLERCTHIGALILGNWDPSIGPLASESREPEALVNDIIQWLEKHPRGKSDTKPVMLSALFASLAFLIYFTSPSVSGKYFGKLTRIYHQRPRSPFEHRSRSLALKLGIGMIWNAMASLPPAEPSSPVPIATYKRAMEALWVLLTKVTYQSSLVTDEIDLLQLLHGGFYLMINSGKYGLEEDDCLFISHVIKDLRMEYWSAKMHTDRQAQYIQDISNQLHSNTGPTSNPSTVTPQPGPLQALTTLLSCSPTEDYLVPSPEIYVFVVTILGKETSTPQSIDLALGLMASFPFPKASNRLIELMSSNQTISQLRVSRASHDSKRQAFAIAQLWLLKDMGLYALDCTSPTLRTLEEGMLLQRPGLVDNPDEDQETSEELESRLFVLLGQHASGAASSERTYYRVLECMLQRRYAPLPARTVQALRSVPERLRGISSSMELKEYGHNLNSHACSEAWELCSEQIDKEEGGRGNNSVNTGESELDSYGMGENSRRVSVAHRVGAGQPSSLRTL